MNQLLFVKTWEFVSMTLSIKAARWFISKKKVLIAVCFCHYLLDCLYTIATASIHVAPYKGFWTIRPTTLTLSRICQRMLKRQHIQWHVVVCFVLPSAPKTYSLANTAQVDTGGVSDKSILKVSVTCLQSLKMYLNFFMFCEPKASVKLVPKQGAVQPFVFGNHLINISNLINTDVNTFLFAFVTHFENPACFSFHFTNIFYFVLIILLKFLYNTLIFTKMPKCWKYPLSNMRCVDFHKGSFFFFFKGFYPSWAGEENHQADQWFQTGEWGQRAHFWQTYN